MMRFIILLLIALVPVVVLVSCSYFGKNQESQTKMIITFLGAPGSGKGTIAEQCVKELGFKTLSTGNLLREAVARGDELGKQADSYMKEGKLVPDELVTSIVETWLARNINSINTLILDGYPRTEKQAELFLALLKNKFSGITLRVVEIVISDDAIVNRLADRLVCSNKLCQAVYSRKMLQDTTKLFCVNCRSDLIRREDDKEEVVRERLKVYAQHAKSLLQFYRSSGIRIDQINVENKTPAQVFVEVKKIL